MLPVIRKGADLNSRYGVGHHFFQSNIILYRDAGGFTPLHNALMFDNFFVVKQLLEEGADLNAQTTTLKLTRKCSNIVLNMSFNTNI